MTVEMSMIFPIVMYVIFSIIYAGMYLHDSLAIHQAIDEIVLECNIAAKYPIESGGEHISYAHINDRGIFFFIASDYSLENGLYTQRLLDKLKSRLLITTVDQPKVTITCTTVSASIECAVNIPFASVRILLGEERLNYSQRAKVDVFSPSEFVRKLTVLSDLVEGSEMGEQCIKRLRDIIKGVE